MTLSTCDVSRLVRSFSMRHDRPTAVPEGSTAVLVQQFPYRGKDWRPHGQLPVRRVLVTRARGRSRPGRLRPPPGALRFAIVETAPRSWRRRCERESAVGGAVTGLRTREVLGARRGDSPRSSSPMTFV